MAAPNPTMAGHLAHGGWGMTTTTMEHNGGRGSFSIGICDVCCLMIAECNHEVSVWVMEFDDDGNEIQVLRCTLCGIDGT